MSKIFEALTKTEGELAEVAKAVLAEDPTASGRSDPQDGFVAPPAEEESFGSSPKSNSGRVRVQTIELSLGSPVLPFDGSDDRAAEQYRMIRTKIQNHPLQPRMILVSSAMPGDGKTVSAINLAAALSLQENLRVLLVDCDFRRSSATGLLGLPLTPGLGEVIRGEVALQESLVRIAQFPNLYVLPSGTVFPGPAELLSTARWQSLLEILRSEFRFVVVDAPPIGAVAEYELLQLACDGIVVVVRQEHTNRQLWQRALETVPKVKQLGVILNCVEQWFLWKTHGYYYYSGKGRQ